MLPREKDGRWTFAFSTLPPKCFATNICLLVLRRWDIVNELVFKKILFFLINFGDSYGRRCGEEIYKWSLSAHLSA